ncbi:alpha-ketoglutarate-dependent dioxygenase AlkB [Corynebacterium ulcerans]|uniref:alpha-ketoglutarate-dependent dioxygenase AlkB n=1 Tax=Corynebacterium ulcerans TaxID=65058 RepID=UPI0006152FE4|nr:alpha-ketoglutarate-dependent dioxygenase AlkB [Corynebacterium ulcerans]OAG70812.1 DNA methylase [Corynebacterium ulcerans]
MRTILKTAFDIATTFGWVPTLFDSYPVPRSPQVIRPGIVHLPGFLSLAEQRAMVGKARAVARRLAHTPLSMHQQQWKTGTMSAHLMSLGKHWEYSSHQYVSEWQGQKVPAIPDSFLVQAYEAMRQAACLDSSLTPWASHYRIDAALVNYYPPDSGMGLHQDAFEESSAPVVSLSIGATAVFRAGNSENRNKPWQDVLLLSGDALVFGGPSRKIFHGIKRIDAATVPDNCGLEKGRINMTFRQVEL